MYTVHNYLSKPLNVILTFHSKDKLHNKVYSLLYLYLYLYHYNK